MEHYRRGQQEGHRCVDIDIDVSGRLYSELAESEMDKTADVK